MRSARPVKPGDRLDAGGRARRVDGRGIAVAVIGQGAGHDQRHRNEQRDDERRDHDKRRHRLGHAQSRDGGDTREHRGAEANQQGHALTRGSSDWGSDERDIANNSTV